MQKREKRPNDQQQVVVFDPKFSSANVSQESVDHLFLYCFKKTHRAMYSSSQKKTPVFSQSKQQRLVFQKKMKEKKEKEIKRKATKKSAEEKDAELRKRNMRKYYAKKESIEESYKIEKYFKKKENQ